MRSVLTASTFLGVGLGGFFDGIFFHQLFQIHNMLSAKYPVQNVDANTLAVHLEVNMFWDGLFHLFTFTMTLVGVLMLWQVARHPTADKPNSHFWGGLFMGWGLFNLIEGIINHHILHIHHVIETANHAYYDYAFLASGVLLLIIGIAWARTWRNAPRHESLHQSA